MNVSEQNAAQNQPKIKVSYPNQRHDHGWIRTWGVMAGNVWESRHLIWQLFRRDLLSRYKKSFVGYAWIFLAPLVGVVRWVFMQKTGLLQAGEMEIPYPVYVLIGTTMWALFMKFFNSAKNSLRSGRSYMMKVNFAHEALLVKQLARQLTDFSIAFVLNLVVMMAFGVFPSWGIVLLPLVALPLFLLSTAVGLIISMVGTVAVDVSKFVNGGMGLLMFITPVIYADNYENEVVQAITRWNPLTYLVCSCRDMMLYGRLYRPGGYFICVGISVVAFLLAWRLFYVSEHKLVERMI